MFGTDEISDNTCNFLVQDVGDLGASIFGGMFFEEFYG